VTRASAKSSKKKTPPVERKRIPSNIKTQVLTEAGYRCAVPSCRELLLLDLHHMYQVSEGGKDEAANLIALCPTCHAYYHRGTIPREAIFAYKSTLVAINRAFDLEAIDRLMFLETLTKDFLIVSGDGVLHFDRLIAAGLASITPKGYNNALLVTYAVNLSAKGKMLIAAWKSGDHLKIKQAITSAVPGLTSGKKSPRANR